MKYFHTLILSFALFVGYMQAMELPEKKARQDLGALLHGAASVRENLAYVKELIGRGADTDYRDKIFGHTALMEAASNGEIEVCEALIKAGADLYARPLAKPRPNPDHFAIAGRVFHLADYISPKKPSYWFPLKAASTSNYGAQAVSEFLLEKMLRIPNEDQKLRLYTAMFCFRQICPKQYSNLKHLFKPHLRMMVQKENAENLESRARAEVNNLDDGPLKQHLLQKYFTDTGVRQ